MKDSAQLFGSPSPEAAKFAIDIFNFEKRIAEITPDISYLNDPVKVNNKMKVKESNKYNLKYNENLISPLCIKKEKIPILNCKLCTKMKKKKSGITLRFKIIMYFGI